MSIPPFAAELTACRAAQESWSRLTVADRLRAIRELRHLLVERADDLIAAEAADVGRSESDVVGSELLPTAGALKFLEKEAGRLLAPWKVPRRLRPTWMFGCRDVVHRRPWGVVGIIGTWNYPVFLNVGQIAQALVAGNGVLWKPSENAARTAEVAHRLFLDAGFPPGLVMMLPATREAGPQLAEAEVDHVVFTGSEPVGRKLAARLGERLVPSTLELSGCDAMFVLADADVELAARAAWFGVVLNRGQTCLAVRRVFVHRSRYQEFADALKQLADGAKPLSLVTPGQAEQARRLVEDAIESGASLLVPKLSPNPSLKRGEEEDRTPPSLLGKGAGGLGSTPSILLDCSPEMGICREASFAPIAAVIPFDSIDTAVSQSSQCPFGLAASIFTRDIAAADALASRIPAGAVAINDALAPTAHPATPFGGRGASGWGVTQGAEGLLAMTTPQTVSVRKGRFRPHADEVISPDPATPGILRGLLRATYGRGWNDRWAGVKQLVRGVRSQRRRP